MSHITGQRMLKHVKNNVRGALYVESGLKSAGIHWSCDSIMKSKDVANNFVLLRSRQIAAYLGLSTLRLGCAKAAHKSTLGCLSARLFRHRFLLP